VCQKRITTKFLTRNVPGHEDGKFGAPAGTLVSTLQSLNNQTFYVNGRAPPFSTPKPVRFICLKRDDGHKTVPMAELSGDSATTIPVGPVPSSVCQMAHKLGELTGQMADAGASVNNAKVSVIGSNTVPVMLFHLGLTNHHLFSSLSSIVQKPAPFLVTNPLLYTSHEPL
jgi:hypothetical protein